MKKRYWVAACVVVLSISVYFLAGRDGKIVNYPPKNSTIVAFGDSLVRGVGSTDGGGFASILSKRIGRPIINLGVPGETSAQGLSRVEELISRNPGMVLVLFGGNDYLRNVPQEETFRNLREIVSRLQSSGAMVVLLGVRGGVLSDQFGPDFEKLAKETGSIYVPDVLDGLLGNNQYMSDAVHPNDQGYQTIADKIYDKIKDYLL